MKKSLIAIVLILIMAVSFCGCGKKEAKTPESFTEYMKEKGFEVSDIAAENDADKIIKSNLVADNGKYKVEFCRLKDEESAKAIYYTNCQIFDEEQSVKTLSVKSEANNHGSYRFNGGDDFYFISWIGDTVLVCVADKSYRKEIIETVENFGY